MNEKGGTLGCFPFTSITLLVGLSSIATSLSFCGGVTGLTGVLGAPNANGDFGCSLEVLGAPNKLGAAGGAGEGVLPKVKGAGLFSVADGGAGEGEAPKVNGDFGCSGAREVDCCPKPNAGAPVPKRGLGASIVGAAVLAAGCPKVNGALDSSVVVEEVAVGVPKSGAGLGVLAIGLGSSVFGAPNEKGSDAGGLGASSACFAGAPKLNGKDVLGVMSADGSAGFGGAAKLNAGAGAGAGAVVGSAGLGALKEKAEIGWAGGLTLAGVVIDA